jgi:hypothetical protein
MGLVGTADDYTVSRLLSELTPTDITQCERTLFLEVLMNRGVD